MNRLSFALTLSAALILGVACGDSSGKPNREASVNLDLGADGPAGDGQSGDITVDSTVADQNTGPVVGFGDICDQTSPCPTGLTCLQSQGATAGFCSKQCTNTGTACLGAPVGTAAFCVAQVQGPSGTQTFCAFICKAAAQTFTCPSTLKCATTDNPPGSGQFGCEP